MSDPAPSLAAILASPITTDIPGLGPLRPLTIGQYAEVDDLVPGGLQSLGSIPVGQQIRLFARVIEMAQVAGPGAPGHLTSADILAIEAKHTAAISMAALALLNPTRGGGETATPTA